MPVRIAILGGGLWSQNTYLPILRNLAEAPVIIAVWSRSQPSATALLSRTQEFAPEVVVYHGEQGLGEVLARPDVEAVLVALAPQVILEVTRKALLAGKSVLSEKPIACSLAAAKEMLRWYGGLRDPPVWGVEENYRSEPAFLRAQQLVRQLGAVARLDLRADFPMLPGSRYFGSGWRRDTEGLPGGFLMESSVHFLAALRDLARAAGWGEAVAASAVASHVRPDLTTPDTLAGVVRFESGGPASVSISFAGLTTLRSVGAVGTQGTVVAAQSSWAAERGAYSVTHQLAGVEGPTSETVGLAGVEHAISSFLACVAARLGSGGARSSGSGAGCRRDPGGGGERGGGALAPGEHARRVSPVEAARDVALVEALLRSSAQGGQLVAVEQVEG